VGGRLGFSCLVYVAGRLLGGWLVSCRLGTGDITSVAQIREDLVGESFGFAPCMIVEADGLFLHLLEAPQALNGLRDYRLDKGRVVAHRLGRAEPLDSHPP